MAEILFTLVLFLPFFLLIFLANLADKRRLSGDGESALAGFTYLIHIVVFGLMMGVGVVIHALGLYWRAYETTAATALEVVAGEGLAPEDFAAIMDSMELIGAALWAPAALAPLFLLPPVRRFLSRLIPCDPKSSVHAVSLSFVTLIVAQLTLTLAVGLETLADLTEASPTDTGSLLVSVWVMQLTFALWGLCGVGWLTRRSWRVCLARLGLVAVRPSEIGVGVGVGAASMVVVLLLEAAASGLGLGVNEDVERLSEALVGPLVSSIPGILTLGLAAGIGEETLFRGALQPRFGIVLTSILFAIVHSQYGITFSTVAVLLLGAMLGLMRQRYNTTTCVAVHASYNISLGLAASFFPQLF